MDNKTQRLPNTHTQPHSNSRPQSHACNQCSRSHHCQSRSHSRSCRSRSQSSSQRRRSHRSPAGHQGQSPGPSPPLRRHRYTMHSHQCPLRPVTHSCSHFKNRKNLEGKVIKRKQVKRSKQVYKRKKQSSGRKYN
ncbi:nuclear transition protein 2 [Odocoileus virginianus]|uniref:Nuclear transition protein 2 n=1 Tax=Odocoileus virginianus TaxID=9874 RepID=A0A6J0WJN7_ODOVR|nr:nuclear transition protein 2 isoform X2 [Odocoileus virginianus texanus]